MYNPFHSCSNNSNFFINVNNIPPPPNFTSFIEKIEKKKKKSSLQWKFSPRDSFGLAFLFKPRRWPKWRATPSFTTPPPPPQKNLPLKREEDWREAGARERVGEERESAVMARRWFVEGAKLIQGVRTAQLFGRRKWALNQGWPGVGKRGRLPYR